jgi:hypothetical protein
MSSPLRRLCNRVGVVLGVLLAVSVPVSCGGSSQTTSTAGSQNGTTTAKSATATSATGAPAGASGSTSSRPTAQTTSTSGGTASTPPHPASPSPGGRLLRRFTGYGNGRLGTIAVHASSLLSWRATQPHIQIFTVNGFMLVNSRSTTGTVRVSRGTYRGVRVSSAARWSVELRAPAP